MVDTLNLLGVISTWIAALLAVIALLGILPAYFIYRATQTDRYLSLCDVDDPRGVYISDGFFGFRKVKVPNLREGPDFGTLGFKNSPCSKYMSFTGWANFATLLKTYGLKFSAVGDFLEFRAKQSFLPVHRGWLLLVGLKGRYANRDDMGITQEAEIDAEMTMFSDSALSGLSGIWCSLPKRPMDFIMGEGIDNICFRAHSFGQMEELNKNDVELKTLFYLFLGLIPSKSGKLFDLEVPKIARARKQKGVFMSRSGRRRSSDSKSHTAVNVESPALWKISEQSSGDVSLWRKHIAFDVKIKLPKIHGIQKCWPVDPSSETTWSNSGSLYYLGQKDPAMRVWMYKSEVCGILLSFFGLQSSPQGFLLGPALSNPDGLLSYVLPATRKLNLLLQMSNQAREHLESRDQKTLLRDALTDAIREEAKINTIPEAKWSRGGMKAFSQLDSVLITACDITSVPMRTIALLFILCDEFRELIFESEKYCEQAVAYSVTLSASENQIIIPRGVLSQPLVIPFEFKALLAGDSDEDIPEDANFGQVDVQYPQLILICLFAELRGVMWDMMLSANDLHTAYTALGGIVHIASSSAPPERNILALAQDVGPILKRGEPLLRMLVSMLGDKIEEAESEIRDIMESKKTSKVSRVGGRRSSLASSDASSRTQSYETDTERQAVTQETSPVRREGNLPGPNQSNGSSIEERAVAQEALPTRSNLRAQTSPHKVKSQRPGVVFQIARSRDRSASSSKSTVSPPPARG